MANIGLNNRDPNDNETITSNLTSIGILTLESAELAFPDRTSFVMPPPGTSSLSAAAQSQQPRHMPSATRTGHLYLFEQHSQNRPPQQNRLPPRQPGGSGDRGNNDNNGSQYLQAQIPSLVQAEKHISNQHRSAQQAITSPGHGAASILLATHNFLQHKRRSSKNATSHASATAGSPAPIQSIASSPLKMPEQSANTRSKHAIAKMKNVKAGDRQAQDKERGRHGFQFHRGSANETEATGALARTKMESGKENHERGTGWMSTSTKPVFGGGIGTVGGEPRKNPGDGGTGIKAKQTKPIAGSRLSRVATTTSTKRIGPSSKPASSNISPTGSSTKRKPLNTTKPVMGSISKSNSSSLRKHHRAPFVVRHFDGFASIDSQLIHPDGGEHDHVDLIFAPAGSQRLRTSSNSGQRGNTRSPFTIGTGKSNLQAKEVGSSQRQRGTRSGGEVSCNFVVSYVSSTLTQTSEARKDERDPHNEAVLIQKFEHKKNEILRQIRMMKSQYGPVNSTYAESLRSHPPSPNRDQSDRLSPHSSPSRASPDRSSIESPRYRSPSPVRSHSAQSQSIYPSRSIFRSPSRQQQHQVRPNSKSSDKKRRKSDNNWKFAPQSHDDERGRAGVVPFVRPLVKDIKRAFPPLEPENNPRRKRFRAELELAWQSLIEK
ncbi:hypothetical protein HDU76_013667 [Blyttiomyces sp. JEL0837]|nr:hypothetical protein HDU76_013667 [Blyttiomyces sp. JEL0837]